MISIRDYRVFSSWRDYVRPFAFFCFAVISGALTGMSPVWAVIFTGVPMLLLLFLALPSDNSIEGKYLYWLFLIYIFVLYSWPHYAGARIPGLFQLQPYRVLYVFVGLYSAYLIRVSAETREILSKVWKANRNVLYVYFLFILFQFVSAFFGKGPVFSSSQLIKDNIIPALLMLICFVLIRDKKKLNLALMAIVLSACFVSIVGIVESLLEKNLFSSLIPSTDEYAAFATTERLRGGKYRAQSTFDSPLALVDFLLTVFPISLYFAIENDKQKKIIGVFSSVLIFIAILRTQSRAGVGIVFAEIGIVFLFVCFKDMVRGKLSAIKWFGFLLALIGLALFVPVLGEIIEKIKGVNAEEAGSTSWRIFMLNGAINKFLNFEWLGAGIGYGASAIGIQIPTRSGFFYVVDSYFLTVFVDSGLFSVIAYVVWCGGIVVGALKIYLYNDNDFGKLALYLAASIIGFVGLKLISSQMQVFTLFYFITAIIFIIKLWCIEKNSSSAMSK